jgi:hypothetical protein
MRHTLAPKFSIFVSHFVLYHERMIQKRIGIPLLVLVGILPMEASAQPILTVAPQVVAGISSWTGATGSSAPLFETPYFAALAGVKVSLWGATGDTDMALALGVGYDARGTGAFGNQNDIHQEYRLNYADLDASIRYRWLEAGVAYGIPLNGHLNLNISNPNSAITNYSSTDMRTTFGIFAAANYSIIEGSSGRLNLVARLDYEMTDTLLNHDFIITSENSPDPLGEISMRKGPIFMARVGLSYEFAVWR